ncbi:LIC_10907 family protein [Leptospira stimsonii]|uniref:LIC_10907 family protein n=1 Tax=Leptospira stimsonii TaxID=2202203 RepID=UPI003CCFE73A
MLKWYDFYELEFSLGSLPKLKNLIILASNWKEKKERIPKGLRLEIFILRLIFKKRILARRYEWSKNELKSIFSEKLVLQNLLEEKESRLNLLEKENDIMKKELEEIGNNRIRNGIRLH